MADAAMQDKANLLLMKAIAERAAHDPRDNCRALLRELKGRNRDGYEQAVSYYETTLLPSVASGRVEPLEAWLDYGRHLASLIAPGRAVEVDPRGAAHDCVPPVSPDRLILHIPHGADHPALIVALPATLSPAQQATCDLLVEGRVTLRD